jgi:hypothetical protein
MIVGTQRTSGRILIAASDLGWWWSRKTPLIEYGAESWERSNTRVIERFETFPERTNTPSSDQRFRSYGHWNLEEVSVLDRSNCLDKFGLWDHFQTIFGETVNTKILENFVTFLTVGRTQNLVSDKKGVTGGWSWGNITGFIFRFELASNLLSICSSKFNSIMHMHMQNMTHVGPICSSPKEYFAQYIRRTYNRWQSHSFP